MDVALLSMAISQGQVQQQASMSLLKTAMNQAEGNVEVLTEMMSESDVQVLQHAAQPHLGGNIDLRG